MNRIFTLLLTVAIAFTAPASAQTVIVSDDPAYTTGQSSSVLDVKSTTKGFLPPRLTQVQRAAIANPAEGLLVYQTDGVKGIYYYTNGAWANLASGTGSQWSLTGNSGTSPALNFLGTTDNTSLRVRTNNTQRMIVDSLGRVAIGTSEFDAANPEMLLVDAGTTESVNSVYAKGSVNNYFQMNIRNLSSGTQASSDYVATANNGTETTNFVNLGINGSGYVYQSGNPIETGKPNDCYLIGSGNDLYIVNNNTAKSILFLVAGTAASNEAMRISPGENVGIATTNPTAKLDVGGTFKLGSGGSILNKIIKTSVTFTDNTNITYTASLTKTVTVTGATPQATVIVNPRSALPDGVSIAWSRVSAGNTVQVNFTNTGAGLFGNQTLGNITLEITIIQ